MYHSQNFKKVYALYRTSTTAAATATGQIDTLGFDAAHIVVDLPTADVVSNKPTVLKLSHSDTTDATNYSDITGYVGGTSFTIPNAITAATSITQPYCAFNVDCRATKRYLKASVSPATTQIVTISADLYRAEQTPATTAQATVVVNPS